MEATQQQNNDLRDANILRKWTCHCSQLFEGAKLTVIGFPKKIEKIATDDPRRIVHLVKVGLALTLVSTLYYVTRFFDSFGDSAMWAVMTVVVVMEYTAGGVVSKGLNRAIATLLAGSLALGAHKIAALCGEEGERIVLSAFVFLLAAAATFARFIPEMKERYDYGMTIFILTFSLVAVSSYRVDHVIKLGSQRVSTITIGAAICLCTSLLLFPVWAGEDLHKLLASNLDKLASFFEGLDTECFGEKAKFDQSLIEKPFLQVHKSVLATKATEDSLPTKTEPKQLPLKIRTVCTEMSARSAKALRGLSSAIRSMTVPSSAGQHASTASMAAAAMMRMPTTTSSDDDDDEMIVTWENVHVAVIASLLSELVDRMDEIVSSVDELARVARFERTDEVRLGTVRPLKDHEIQEQVSITIMD